MRFDECYDLATIRPTWSTQPLRAVHEKGGSLTISSM
jgi:hypothetical protein